MRTLLLTLGTSIILAGCSTPYVNRDPSLVAESRQEPVVSSFLYAYLQPSTLVMKEGADNQPIDSLLKVKAKSSALVAAAESEIQSLDDKVINWVRVKDTSGPTRIFSDSYADQAHCPEIGNTPWDKAYERFICEYSKSRGHTTTETGTTPKLIAVEPEYGFYDQKYLDKVLERELELDNKTKQLSQETTIITDEPSAFWPVGKGMTWHRGPNYSQLDAAREIVNQTPIGNAKHVVKAAHLDSGYFADDRLRPKKLLEGESKTCLPKGVLCHTDSQEDGDRVVKRSDGNHGARTISVLAGATAKLDATKYPAEVTVGSYPELPVASYRIATTLPVHFNPSAMAIAISDATDNNFDVVGLSQGGFPSIMLREAVNKAYNEGTAIFAATGDYYSVLFLGSITPRTVAFPARFNRVMAVAAVTADHTNYSDDPCYLCLWRFLEIDSWMLRGSYGPSSAMAGHSIAAYAPNITTSVSSKDSPNAIQLDGEGVSFAVPQVAAAASMWLQQHNSEFSSEEWGSWKKTEAVYQALIQSAERNFPKYSCEYMGEGALRAADALSLDKTQALGKDPKPREVSTIGYKWVFDLIMSWDALKMAIALPVQGGLNFGNQFQKSLKEMVLTEIQQILHRSDKASEFFEKIYPALPGKGCPSFDSKPQYVKEFIEQLLSEEKISNLLRTFLKGKFQEVASSK